MAIGIPQEWIPRLDPEWVAMWKAHGSTKKRADEVTVDEYRRNPTAYSFTYPVDIGPEVPHVEDLRVRVSNPTGEVVARMYSPESNGPVPVHFNMHGGGWVLGGLTSEQAWCRHVCNSIGIKVVDIDYRLAPEYKFPVAIHDCWTVVKYFISNANRHNIDPDSVSVGGLSAGGHMATVLSMFARQEKINLKLQLMVVPSVDLRWEVASEPARSESFKTYPCIAQFANMPWGPRTRYTWFLKHWLGEDQAERDEIANSWVASPMLAESLQGLAPAHIITAEFDLTRDESEKYGSMLQSAGVPTTMKRYLGVPHAFGHYNHPERGLKKSHEYIRDTCEVLKQAHNL